MENQTKIRLTLPRPAGVGIQSHAYTERLLNNPPGKMAFEAQLSRLLKRLAKSAMAGVTECPPVALPAHLARLDDLREIIDLTCLEYYGESGEGQRSEHQLQHPHTLADYSEAMRQTKANHRCPAWISDRDYQLEKIFRGIDQLAGLISQNPQLVAFLTERGQE